MAAGDVSSDRTGERRQDPGQPSLDGPPDIERRGRNAAEAGHEQPEHVAAEPGLGGRGDLATPVQPTLDGTGHSQVGPESTTAARRFTAKGGTATFVSTDGDEVEIVSVTLRVKRAAPKPAAVRARDLPREIWAHYEKVIHGRDTPRALPDDERRIIREALKVAGETNAVNEPAAVAECKAAIEGCAASDFHMGRADPSRYRGRRRAYNDLSQILKGKRGGRTTREQIEFFGEIAKSTVTGPGVASATSARIVQAKRDVLDAHEFPGDESAQRRGEEARAWLTEQGWQIENDPTGRPQFRPPA